MYRAIATTLLLVFCMLAEAKQPASTAQALVIPTGHGVVYVYRPRQFTNALIKPGIVVDGREYPMLPTGKFLKFVLPEGDHLFDLKMSDTYHGSAAGRLRVLSGEIYYVRLDTSIEDIDYKTSQRLFSFDPVATTEAVPQIAKCKAIDLEKGKFYKKSSFSDN